MRNRRITKPCFRICSTCLSRSQAPLCLYTRHAIADRAEGTFGRLRYLLGGDRPSQTAHQTLSPIPIQGPRLEFQQDQGGISRSAPPHLAARLQCLPPILHKPGQNPMSGYSKGPRGLSVQSWVDGIFTATAISPDPSLRQRPSRCTIRAGRNLPDKEFRYLRTVIVTAAVYRGFSLELAPRPLTFRHRAGVSPYTSSYDFAETCVFGKQSPRPLLCGPSQLLMYTIHQPGHPLSRSYGVILPSSLTRVLPSTLGFSPRLPVSVCGTVTCMTRYEGFLGSLITTSWLARRLVSPSPLRVISSTDLPVPPSYWLRPTFPPVGWPSLLRHPFTQSSYTWYRNLNLFPISYASRPRLRGRLTLSGLAFLRKP